SGGQRLVRDPRRLARRRSRAAARQAHLRRAQGALAYHHRRPAAADERCPDRVATPAASRSGMITASSIEIRRARASDAAALTRIAHAAKRHWGYSDALIELWNDELTVSADFIDAYPVYVAVRGAIVLGFYALSHENDVFELEHMWVDPPHIGGGV